MGRIVGSLAVLAACLWAGGGPVFAEPDPFEAPEYTNIYYPRNACESDQLELQVWDLGFDAWFPHPEHPLVPVETCQLEDPGILLNGIRWRCATDDAKPDAGWYVGLDIFDPAITESCEVGALEEAEPSIEIHVARPDAGMETRSAESFARVEGSVRMGGIEGVEYDVLIAIDRSAAGPDPEERLHAQVEAARQWLRDVDSRLGDVRVGILSYPDGEPPEPPAARVHAAPTTDRMLLGYALESVLERGVAGAASFATGLGAAIDLLVPRYEARVRPRARPHVLITLDGDAAPLVEGASSPDLATRTHELAQRAQQAGVRVHLFALGGGADEPGPVARDFLATSLGRLERVQPEALATPFFASATLPTPEGLVIVNPRTQAVTAAEVDARGRFRAEVPVLPGPNPLELVVTTSDERSQSLDWLVRFDDTLLQRRRAALERERLRETRGQAQDVQAEVRTLPPDPWGAGSQ